MKKARKPLFSSEKESNELSELLTRERVKSANIKTPNVSAKDDPDLAALLDSVRVLKKSKAPRKGVSRQQIRKLAGLK